MYFFVLFGIIFNVIYKSLILFKETITKRRIELGYTQSQVAELIGISQKAYSMYESGTRKPRYSIAHKLQEVLRDSTIVGLMFPNQAQNEAKPIPHTEYFEVLYLPATANAGYAAGFADNSNIHLDTMLVPREYEKGNYLVIEIIGDSMDDGTDRTIAEGDKLLIKEIARDGWVFTLPFKRHLFVITTRDGVICKQITAHNLETRTITCHSFNPIFKDFSLSLENDVLQLFFVKKIVEKQIRL